MKITGLTDDELLILINTLHASMPGSWHRNSMDRKPVLERKKLMGLLSNARTELIIEKNKARYDMAQDAAREDR